MRNETAYTDNFKRALAEEAGQSVIAISLIIGLALALLPLL